MVDLAQEYLDRYASKKRSVARDGEIHERDVVPEFGRVHASAASPSDIWKLFEAKSAAAPVAANRLLACLSKLFNWGTEQELVTVSPCSGIKKNPEKARDRVLTDTEIRTFGTKSVGHLGSQAVSRLP